MLSVIFLILFTVSCSGATNLFSPNIYYSDVYASSAQHGSKPEYAVDADFFEEKPTCFATDSRLPDTHGFHWILIDFGATIINIREIRLIVQTDENEDAQNISQIEAFVIDRLSTPKIVLNSSTEFRNEPLSLAWDSPNFQPCPVTEQSSSAGPAVTLQCPQSYAGRWLAIRRRKMLHICLVNIYIEQAFEECFETLPTSNGRYYYGTVFRYVRHTPREACRSTCMQSTDCEASLFIKQRHSGICQLINEFRFVDPSEPNFKESTNLLDCPEDKCIIEMNHCHGGTVQELEKPESANESTPSSKATTSHILQEEWWVKKPKSVSTDKPSAPVYVLSVYFEGKLECDAWDCGPVYVVLVDANETEQFCGRIESAHVSHLEKAILFCNTTDPIYKPSAVRLRWYQSNAEANPRLKFNIQRGNIRISHTKPLPPFERKTSQDPSTSTSSMITTKTPTTETNTDTMPIIVPQFIGSTEALAMEADSFTEFSTVTLVPTDMTDRNHKLKSVSNQVDDVDDINMHESDDDDDKSSLEFNYLLNDQQPQSEEHPNSVRLQIKENHTGTTPPQIPTDRTHEKRNILRQSGSPIQVASINSGEVLQPQSTSHLIWSFLYVTIVQFIL